MTNLSFKIKIHLRSYFFFVLLFTQGFSFASSPVSVEFPVEKFKLPSGMTVLLAPNSNIPMISYQTWFRVGSRDELDKESGLAHMLEHMMFKGSKRFSNKEFDRILHENGISNNAFTTYDYTGYYENLPSSKLELIMDIEADRLLNIQLKEEDLKKELEVVKEERRMRVDNNPQGMAWEALFGNLFEKHRYKMPVIGTMEDITNYQIDMLKRFYAKWYRPSNAVLIIVGDFDLKKTKDLVKKYYSEMPKDLAPPREKIPESEASKSKLTQIEKQVQAPLVMIAWKTPEAGTDEAYALDFAASLLGDGKSSRLFQQMIYQDKSAIYVGAGNYTLQEHGVFYISANLKPGQTPGKAAESVEKEIQKLHREKVSSEELQKVKNQIMSTYVNSIRTIDGKARLLAMNEILFGDYREFFKDLERYNKVTSEDIQKVVKKYLRPEKKTTVFLQGTKK